MRAPQRIWLITVLMMITCALGMAAVRQVGFLIVFVLPFMIAAVGAILVRVCQARWPELVRGTALGAAVVCLFGLYDGNLLWTLAYIMYLCIGIYLLPLADPQVRRDGPAPSIISVIAASGGLVLLIIGFASGGLAVLIVGFAMRGSSGSWAWSGLDVLCYGAGIAIVLGGIGLLATLARKQAVGAWMGGTGLILGYTCVGIWILTGSQWFP